MLDSLGSFEGYSKLSKNHSFYCKQKNQLSQQICKEKLVGLATKHSVLCILGKAIQKRRELLKRTLEVGLQS